MKARINFMSLLGITFLLLACNNNDLSKIGRKTEAGWTFGDIKEIKETVYKHGFLGPSSRRDYKSYRFSGDEKYLLLWNQDDITYRYYIFNEDSTIVIKEHNNNSKKQIGTEYIRLYDKKGFLQEETYYDVYDKGLIESERIFYKYKGEDYSKETFDYKGNLISTSYGTVDINGNFLTKENYNTYYTLEYDKNFCLIEEYAGDSYTDKTSRELVIRRTYNKKGCLMTYQSFIIKKGKENEFPTRDYSYEYDYDEYGNWILKFEITHEGTINSFTKREISYK